MVRRHPCFTTQIAKQRGRLRIPTTHRRSPTSRHAAQIVHNIGSVPTFFRSLLDKVTNRDFVPSRITFAHTRNSDLREIHRILRCPVEFACAADSWVFPQSFMELPIVSKDSYLLQILETHADDLLSRRNTGAGFRGLVENQLVSVLPSGKAQAAAIAQKLGMSERSFRRRLAEEGATFSEILDRVRNRLALRYLEDQRVSLQQIAWLLGYSELAAFNHAFKRWFGTSPRIARRPSAAPALA